jgi:hypothetical protein
MNCDLKRDYNIIHVIGTIYDEDIYKDLRSDYHVTRDFKRIDYDLN